MSRSLLRKHLRTYTSVFLNPIRYRIAFLIFIYLVVYNNENLLAQSSNLDCNTHTVLNPDNGFNNLDVTVDGFTNPGNFSDNNMSNFSRWTSLLLGSAYIQIEDTSFGPGEGFPGGSYASVIVDNTSLATILGGATVSTYLDGVLQESESTGSLIAVSLGSNLSRIGFYTTMEYDAVRFSVSSLGVIINVDAYYAEIKGFCDGPDFVSCGGSPSGSEVPNNTNIYLNNPDFPTIVNPDRTGFSGVLVGSITNADNAIDDDPSSFANVSLNVGVLATASFSIEDVLTTGYASGTYAGFDIAFSSLVDASVLGGIEINTYLNGVLQENYTSAELLTANSGLLSGEIRQTIGFVASTSFDEIQVQFNQPVAVNLGTIKIYGAVIKRFCSATISSTNVLVEAINPEYPTYINWDNTGLQGTDVCVGCGLDNSENIIDDDIDNYATLVLTTTVASSYSVSVAHELDTYQPNTFVGFEIATGTLLSADVAASATITLYNNGVEVQQSTGNSLLVGASTALLEGGMLSRQPVGVVAKVPYDEVQITFTKLAGADLGETRIYNALFSNTVPGMIDCDQPYILTQDAFPVFINSERTGTTGVVGVSEISEVWNVVTNPTTDYAELSVSTNVISGTSISVVDAVSEYPAGSIAGFVIETFDNALLELDLLDAITISTYNNDVFVESFSASGSLLSLDLNLGFGSSGDIYYIGVETTQPYDEIVFSIVGIAGVDLLNNPTRIYGAYVDKRFITDGPDACPQYVINPDINVTAPGVTVLGDIKTNDQISTSITYSNAVSDVGNPPGATLNLNSDGTYDFTPTIIGVYNYQITSCVSGLSTCEPTYLTIYVNDDEVTNDPIANHDYGDALVGNDITLNSLDNDETGNNGFPLDPSTFMITQVPVNGNASADASGNVTYSPNVGFVGKDSLVYSICDTDGNCAQAFQYFYVYPSAYDNTTFALDDIMVLYDDMPVNGNVANNDYDKEGDTQLVTAQNVTVMGVGTLVLNTNGTYTFTPDSEFQGAANFEYEICDNNGIDPKCAMATLYILSHNMPVLPVTMKAFDVKSSECINYLSWSTSQEVNNDYFIIRRSFDGNNFEEIGTVDGNGNSHSTVDYTFEDKEGISGYTNSYYQLIQVDLDGRMEKIRIIGVQNDCSASTTLHFYPNPVSNYLHIENNLDESTVLTVVKEDGKMVFQNLASRIGNTIDVANWQTGKYIYTLKNKYGKLLDQGVIIKIE